MSIKEQVSVKRARSVLMSTSEEEILQGRTKVKAREEMESLQVEAATAAAAVTTKAAPREAQGAALGAAKAALKAVEAAKEAVEVPVLLALQRVRRKALKVEEDQKAIGEAAQKAPSEKDLQGERRRRCASTTSLENVSSAIAVTTGILVSANSIKKENAPKVTNAYIAIRPEASWWVDPIPGRRSHQKGPRTKNLQGGHL